MMRVSLLNRHPKGAVNPYMGQDQLIDYSWSPSSEGTSVLSKAQPDLKGEAQGPGPSSGGRVLVFQGLSRSCRGVSEGHLGPKHAEGLLTAVLVSPVMSGNTT